jgi:type IV secretory pathway protease TraF
MTRVHQWPFAVARITCGLVALAALADVGPGRRRELQWNRTPSLPLGLYGCQRIDDSTVLTPETLVAFDPPQWIVEELHRVAPKVHVHTMLKKLVAVEHDTVCLQGNDVTVHGVVIAHRPLLETYPLTTPTGCVTVGHDQLLLMGTNARSYDSRYFGLAERTWVRATCMPLWTWEARR